MRDAKENREKKMVAWNPGGEKHACLSPPGFHATIFFSRFSSASRTTDKGKEGLLVVYHFFDDSMKLILLIPFELQPTSNTSRRKEREAYLIHWGQTPEPSGMNRRNERWLFNLIALFKTDLFFAHGWVWSMSLDGTRVSVDYAHSLSHSLTPI